MNEKGKKRARKGKRDLINTINIIIISLVQKSSEPDVATTMVQEWPLVAVITHD